MNAGGVSFDVNINGARTALNQVKSLNNKMVTLDDVLRKNKKAQEDFIATFAKKDVFSNFTKGVKNTHQLLNRLGKEEKRLTTIIVAEEKRKQAARAESARKQELQRIAALRMAVNPPASGFGAWAEQYNPLPKIQKTTTAIVKQATETKKLGLATHSGYVAWSKQQDAIGRVVRNATLYTKLHGPLDRIRSVIATTALTTVRLGANAAKAAIQLARIGGSAIIAGFTKLRTKLLGITTATGRTNTQLAKNISLWHRLRTAMTGAGAGYSTWWKRFGVIAIGFAIAYRAIYAFQMAVSSLARAFFGGLTIMDDYAEGLATIAGMIALTYESDGDFGSRFTAAHKTMEKSMENAIRLAPKYRLSMEEITAGFRELAQFGVVVTPDITEKSMNTIAMIKEISMSAGSTTKQIRQEIQALFNGQVRVTDQFAKMIQITMPDLFKLMQDETLSSTAKWKLLNDAVWDFNAAIRVSNQTVKNQASIAKKTLEIISMNAIRQSGIFDKWVTSLREFNMKLFDVEGNLLPLGEKIKEIFADIWTSVDYALKAVVNFGEILSSTYTKLTQLSDEQKKLATVTFKAASAMFVLKTAMQMILTLLRTLGLFKILSGVFFLFEKIVTRKVLLSVAGGFVSMGAAIPGIVAGLVSMLGAFGPVLLVIGGVAAGIWGLSYAFGGLEELIPQAMNSIVEVMKFKFKELMQTGKIFVTDMKMLFAPDRAELDTKVADLKKYIATMPGDMTMHKKWLADAEAALDPDQLLSLRLRQQEELDAMRTEFEGRSFIDWPTVHAAAKAGGAQFEAEISNIAAKVANAFKFDISFDDSVLDGWRDKITGIKQTIMDALGVLDFKNLPQEWQDMLNNLSNVFGDGLNNLIAKQMSAKDWMADRDGGIQRVNRLDYGVSAERPDLAGELHKISMAKLDIEKQMNKLVKKTNNLFLGRKDAALQNLDLQQQLLDNAEATKQAYIDHGDILSDEYRNAVKEVNKLTAAFKQAAMAQKLASAPPTQAFVVGMIQWSNSVEQVGTKFNKLGKEIIPSIASGFSQVFGQIFTGEITSFTDLWEQSMQSLHDSFAKAMQGMLDIYINEFLRGIVEASAQSGLMDTVIGAFGNFLGMTTGYGGNTMNATDTSAAGDWINSNAHSAFASGGIIPEHVLGVGASGRTYEFGENGPERVLSNSDSFEPQVPNVTVNVINKTSNEVTASQGNTRFDGRRFVVEAILEDIDRGGPLKSVMGGSR